MQSIQFKGSKESSDVSAEICPKYDFLSEVSFQYQAESEIDHEILSYMN